MSIKQTTQRGTAPPGRLPVWWLTIAMFAVVVAYADGFWVTTLQGAVATFEHSQPPFQRWLRDSTMMLPLYTLAVLAAVLLARRWVGQSRHGLVKYGTTALLIVVLSSGVGIGRVAVGSASDYHAQTSGLAGHQDHQTVVAAQPGATEQSAAGSCTGICAMKQKMFTAHVRAALHASVMLLVTNLVLVCWVLALRSDRLWRRSYTTQMNSTTVVLKENWSVA